jgi:protein-L-isoaspartate(D-aspartate) O-methyltransferase
MVETQLISRGISDRKVLEAFNSVPRHEFVGSEYRDIAYSDAPLPIGSGQTISQPYMVALMTQCLGLKGADTVLEIGSGSGYQAAILSRIAGKVYSVERVPALASSAASTLKSLGCSNVEIVVGDGTLGLPEHAPYDGIIVTAGSPDVPQSLMNQLKQGARLVIPVGGEFSQALTVVERHGDKIKATEICGCVFVPLIGKEGWVR